LIIGILTIELLVPGAGSLKEKRMAVRSIKEKLRNRFNVSVAELEDHDKWQRVLLGIATLGAEKRFINSVLDKAAELVRSSRGVEIADYQIELL